MNRLASAIGLLLLALLPTSASAQVFEDIFDRTEVQLQKAIPPSS